MNRRALARNPKSQTSTYASRERVQVEGGGGETRNSRPRNEIVWKPNAQPNVYAQVAKQSGMTEEQVSKSKPETRNPKPRGNPQPF